ncbi:MAG: class 1b ribonucleoside-diphosphate reductase subunit beta [Firmicutes bacterium]|nr:class 1b ribonucleoside-diphosphate reductase subunit beta [Bacillota bacterium]
MYGLRQNDYKKEAVNWNAIKREKTQLFWNQNIRQFWVDEEIPVADDKLTYKTLTDDQKDTYTKILAGLTLLDTEQGTLGTPQLAMAIEDLPTKSVLAFSGMMEHMHAKSYSTIFSSLCTTAEIDQLFAWVKDEPLMQKKLAICSGDYYCKIKDEKSLYMACAASVFLESFIFYSGFFYPLYLAGQGKLVSSGEIINLIVRDEVIHGMFVGTIAQEIFATKFDEEQQDKLEKEVKALLLQLYQIELEYTKSLYTKLGLVDDVVTYIQYHADYALKNLGFAPMFGVQASQVNAIVMSGLDTKTKNHDFFSTKGNGYIKQSNVEKLSDEDFDV